MTPSPRYGRSGSTDLGAEVETALAEVQEGVVPEDRSVRLLVGHIGSEIADVATELRGTLGVVTTEAEGAAAWVLDVVDAQTAEPPLPDGGTVTLDLPDMDPAAIDAELDRLEDGAEPAPVESRVREPVDSAAESEADQAPRLDEAWCEVRLLGPTGVVRGGARVEGLTARPMEILAYLATHRDGASKERLEVAVWSGRAAAPTSQRVTAALTKVREALGEAPDGAPLVPRRTAAQRIQLSEYVGTDIDRALGTSHWHGTRPSRSPAVAANVATSTGLNMPRDRASDSSIQPTLSTSNWQRSRSNGVTPRESACSGSSFANVIRKMPMRSAVWCQGRPQRQSWPSESMSGVSG